MNKSRVSKSKTKNKATVLGNRRKPPLQKVDEKAIPDFLKQYDRWVGWKWEWNETANHGKGQWNKPPKNATTGSLVSATDPATWSSFTDAMAGMNAKRVDGIGFVLGETDDGTHISGIDLDDCRNSTDGRLNELSRNVIAVLDTYAARLALVIHCVRSTIVPGLSWKIDKVSMLQALELVSWFKQEARRVYSLMDNARIGGRWARRGVTKMLSNSCQGPRG